MILRRSVSGGNVTLVIPYVGREEYQFMGQWADSGINTYAIAHREVARVTSGGEPCIQNAYKARKVITLYDIFSSFSREFGGNRSLDEMTEIVKGLGPDLSMDILFGIGDLVVERISDKKELEGLTQTICAQELKRSFSAWPERVSTEELKGLRVYSWFAKRH